MLAHGAMRPSRNPSAALSGRLVLIGLASAIVYLGFLAVTVMQGQWLIDGHGRPVASDFVNVWAAGRLAIDGQPAAAYDWTIHKQVENAAVGYAFEGYYNWNYPPTFLFAAAPLALVPFVPSVLAWLASTFAAYVAAVRTIVGARAGMVLACGFPGVLWTFTTGQNGFLTAALIGGALALMDKAPIAAGVLLGLLTYKPHFGILFPLALVLDRRWCVVAAAATTALLLAAASWGTFGTESWRAFFDSVLVTGTVVFAEGRAGLNKLQSLFGLVRWLGGGTTFAWMLHGTLMAVCIVAVSLLWRSRVAFDIKAAALAVGALLATPYLYIYDFPVLAVPIAFIVRIGLREGFLAYEGTAMAAACLLVLSFPLVSAPVGPLAVAIVALLIARRAACELVLSHSRPT
jgi:hypothetical protein